MLFRFAMDLTGLGNLSPNLIMVGFKENWRLSPEETSDYFSILQYALELRLSIGILRIKVFKTFYKRVTRGLGRVLVRVSAHGLVLVGTRWDWRRFSDRPGL